MKRITVIAVVVGMLSVGCKKKWAEEDTGMSAGSSHATGSSGEVGSAVPAGSAGASMGNGSAAMPAKPLTAEELAHRYEECWGFWNDAKWDDFKGCYTSETVAEAPGLGVPAAHGVDAAVTYAKDLKTAFPDLKGEIQLLLVNGHNTAGVVLVTGTHEGPMKTPMGELPATHKKIGYFVGQVLELDDTGHVKQEADVYDAATIMGQLNPNKAQPVRAAVDKLPMPKELVIAKGDAKEQANLATDNKMIEAFNKHDAKAFGDMLANDVQWSDVTSPKDDDKKAAVSGTQQFWKGFSDIKITPSAHWAAGDYVVTIGSLAGTNDGDMPAMKMKKTGKQVQLPFVEIDKLDGDKVKVVRIFYQGMGFAAQLGLLPPAGGAGSGGSGGKH